MKLVYLFSVLFNSPIVVLCNSSNVGPKTGMKKRRMKKIRKSQKSNFNKTMRFFRQKLANFVSECYCVCVCVCGCLSVGRIVCRCVCVSVPV